MAGLTGNERTTTHLESGAYIGTKTPRGTEDHRTPEKLFKGLSDLFGPFDLDAAASKENTKCESFFTHEENAFFQDWFADKVWCNPPYHNIEQWIDTALIQLQNNKCSTIVFLLPSNRTEQRWFLKSIVNCSFIGFIRGRINFEGPNQVKGSNSPSGSIVLVLGHSDIKGIGFLNRSGILQISRDFDEYGWC